VPDGAILLPLVLGAFGACVGSFLNVVIYRLPRRDPERGGLSVAKPSRSFCPSCRRTIPWAENVPIVSWVVLGGRCRGCKAEISVRYLFVEVLTAFLFAWWTSLWLRRAGDSPMEWVVLGVGLLLTAVCVAVTFIDLEWREIPDEITLPGVALGLLLSAAAPVLQRESWVFGKLAHALGWEAHLAAGASSLAGALVGGLTLLLVAIAGKAVFKPKDAETGEPTDAMGFGDVKYMAMMGAFLGADGVLLVFFLGCVAGAIAGLLWFLVKRDRYIPFGPYLSLGILAVLYFRTPIVRFLLEDWPRMVQGLFLPD
jgi:leader peptidase (prepilin peptidase)/N-methyltransferase